MQLSELVPVASPDLQCKLEALVSLQLLEASKPELSLREVMRLISERHKLVA